MKKFQVSIEGNNLILNFGEGPIKVGFYTTRFVEAKNAKEAEIQSIDLIKNDPELKGNILNEKSNTPMLYIENIVEVKSFGDNAVPGNGYTFYPDDEG